MTAREEASRLLELARMDLTALRHMENPEHFADPVFGFHAQQAVEKALKAWLCLRAVSYPKTHDLRLLLRLLQDQGENVASFLSLMDLTDFAVQFRYDVPELGPDLERGCVADLAETLLDHISSLLAK